MLALCGSSQSGLDAMLPAIAHALSIEMLRDGGSLCASFQGTDGSQYWLLLPVVIAGPGTSAAAHYGLPVIVERPFAPEELQVSWEHARLLLQPIEDLLPPNANRAWVQPMYDCIRAKGRWSRSNDVA